VLNEKWVYCSYNRVAIETQVYLPIETNQDFTGQRDACNARIHMPQTLGLRCGAFHALLLDA
jgi:hypothetical protein